MKDKKLIDVPPGIHLLIGGVTATASLAFTQAFISNRTEKLVTGAASIWLPIAYIALVALLHLAHARTTAARIAAGQPTTPQLLP